MGAAETLCPQAEREMAESASVARSVLREFAMRVGANAERAPTSDHAGVSLNLLRIARTAGAARGGLCGNGVTPASSQSADSAAVSGIQPAQDCTDGRERID